jgi:hypothetical protein
MHIGRETTRYELGENNSAEGKLIYAPERKVVEIATEQQRENTLV